MTRFANTSHLSHSTVIVFSDNPGSSVIIFPLSCRYVGAINSHSDTVGRMMIFDKLYWGSISSDEDKEDLQIFFISLKTYYSSSMLWILLESCRLTD